MIISILLIEVLSQLSWFKFYFTNGIPVYKRKYPFFGSLKDPFDTTHFQHPIRDKANQLIPIAFQAVGCYK
jgi:hypothetical protein